MLKKIAILPLLIGLSACSTQHTDKQDTISPCDPSINYVKTNVDEKNEFMQLKAANKIRSFYFEYSPNNNCDNEYCVSIDPKNFDFLESYYDTDTRKGVYTITATQDLKDKDCSEKVYKAALDDVGYCYKITKNPNDVVKSQYKLKIGSKKVSDDQSTTFITLSNLKNQEDVYSVQYQTYKGTVCKLNSINM